MVPDIHQNIFTDTFLSYTLTNLDFATKVYEEYLINALRNVKYKYIHISLYIFLLQYRE